MIVVVSLFFMCLVVAAPVSNLLLGVVGGISIAILILNYRRISNKQIPKLLLFSAGIFLGGILLSSIAHCNLLYIKKCFKLFSQMLPFFLFYYMVLVCDDNKLPKILLWSFNLALFVTVISAFRISEVSTSRVMAFYGHPNRFATMLDILLPFCLVYTVYYIKKSRFNWRFFFLILNVVLGCYVMVLSGSRGGWGGILLGLLGMLFFYICKMLRPIKVLKILTITLTIGFVAVFALKDYAVVSFSRSYDNERILLLKSSYNMWNDHKVFGVGIDNWAKEYHEKYILPEAKEPNLVIPHNIYAEYFSTTGIVGGVGYICMLVGFVLFLLKYFEVGGFAGASSMAMLWALLAISVHGMVDVGLGFKTVIFFFFSCLGITSAVCIKTANKSNK